MLLVKIELWPFGNAEKAQTIAAMRLWNDGTGSAEIGNYIGQAETLPSPWLTKTQVRDGEVKGHARNSPLWSLVAKMLNNMKYP